MTQSSTTSPFDPQDWEAFRVLGRQMVDDLVDQLQGLTDGPVWRPMPDSVRSAFQRPSPGKVEAPEAVYADYLANIAPYAGGNRHPGFMGWVQGGGAPIGALAELLTAGLNMNCGGRDHVGIALEQQISLWVGDWFGLPQGAQGLFVTGASMANFVACLAARTRVLGPSARALGVGAARLTAYAAQGAHACVIRAMEMAGLGREALRLVPLNAEFQMDVDALRAMIAKDVEAGFTPFLITATAGSVDVGAFDDLEALADIAADRNIWLHVDGAFGALGVHSARVRSRLAGLRRVQSVAFDFHKWGQVPYDAGFVIVAEGERLTDVFASPAAYLSREPTGLAAGDFWPTDHGPDLSRGCRALKTWFVLRTCGVEAIGEAIDRSLDLAAALRARVAREPRLQPMGPSELNIVCFRYLPDAGRDGDAVDGLNRQIAQRLQLAGRVAPSITRIGGKVALRAALFNPRSTHSDVDALVEGVLAQGAELAGEMIHDAPRAT
jgi:glutamate/tyrosine decarboxylase-like PLP-dependent enzyme